MSREDERPDLPPRHPHGGFASAAALLVEASVRNRLKRLAKHPRQLIFLGVGGAYFYMVGFARTRAASVQTMPQMDPSHVPPWLAFFVVAYLMFVWLFGDDTAVLAFTEAEVDFFFTAPVSRRQLVHYKLVRTLLASLVTGVFFAFVFRRGGRPLFAAVGFFLGLSTIALHRVCASMTRTSLLDHGVTAAKRRVVTLAVVAAVIGTTALSVWRAASALPTFEAGDPFAWMEATSTWASAHATGLSWVLFPVAAMVRVTSATTATQFFAALPAAVAVLGAHYVWAMSTDVAFEESSAEAAKKLARKIDDLRAGRLGPVPRTPPLFRLGSGGAPWVAIFWKNLLAGTRISRRQLVAWGIILVGAPLLGVLTASHGTRSSLGPMVFGIAAFIALLGPHMTQNDLRQDIDAMDILRSYPVDGRQIVVGEVLAPLAMLAVIEWALLAVAAGLGLATGSHALFLLAVGCALPFPAFTACMLLLRNLGALWLPAWAGSSAQTIRGIEAFGQRLVIVFGTLAVLAVVLIPAGIAGGGLGFLLWPWLGYGMAPVVGAVAAAVALAEAFVGVVITGYAFERFDVAGR